VTRPLDPADLPENVARYAQAQVSAGRFASVEEVLSAGIDALQQREQREDEWLAYARKEAAELDQGEGIRGTAEEHMARIDAAVRARTAERAGR
jgi:Arc/MetJ-type ribon-helix-helix transcriptional regulator